MELKSIFDTHKSFYKKAFYVVVGNNITLYSYNTKVCEIDTNAHTYEVWEGNCYFYFLTNTTLRHVKEFLKQFYFKKDVYLTKKAILKNAVKVN